MLDYPLGGFLSQNREWALYVNGRYREVLAEHQRATRLGIAGVYLDSFEGNEESLQVALSAARRDGRLHLFAE